MSENAKYLVAYIYKNDYKLTYEEVINSLKIETGMGSVEIDIANKNFLDIEDIEEIERGGIKYSVKNGILKLKGTSTANFYIQLSKNIKIKKGKYTHSSNYIQSGLYISLDNLGYTMLNATAGKKKTFELKEDKIYTKYFIWIDKGIVLNNVEIKLQLEKGDTTTNFIEHQFQTSIMPIQQEMLQGDYIEDVEHHEWGKYIFTGEETIENIGKSGDITFFKISLSDLSDFNYIDDNTVNYMCTHFKAIKVADRFQNNTFFINIEKKVSLCSQEITTIDALKAYLKARYDANDPVVIYYKLATSIDLELTEAQKAVREQKLHTYKNITNINLSDELASIDVTYKKDLDTILNNLQAQIIANASEEVTE